MSKERILLGAWNPISIHGTYFVAGLIMVGILQRCGDGNGPLAVLAPLS
jgi:hypothetical protein